MWNTTYVNYKYKITVVPAVNFYNNNKSVNLKTNPSLLNICNIQNCARCVNPSGI